MKKQGEKRSYTFWTKEMVLELLEKCGSTGELAKTNKSAHQVALNHGWLDNFKRPKRTYQECYDAAKSCETKTEFYYKCNKQYNAARYHGWMKDYKWLKKKKKEKPKNKRKMEKKKRQPKYSFEECLNESKKYPSRTQFKKHNRRLYSASERYGWLDSFTWLTPKNKQSEQKGRHQTWTLENTMAASKSFQTLQDFRAHNRKAYQAAYLHDWLKNFTWLERKKPGRQNVEQPKPIENVFNWETLRLEAVKTILPLVMQANPNGSATTLSRTAIQHADEMVERVQKANKK